MPKKPEYTGISIKGELAEDAEEFIKDHPRLGFRTLTQFVEDATRRRLEDLRVQIRTLPRFDRVNGDEEGVRIYDRELKDDKVVHISIRPNGVRCDFHQSGSCEHVKYALTLPDVQEMIRRRRKEGWKIEVPE